MASNPKYQGDHRTRRQRFASLVRGGTVRCARGAECCYAEMVGGLIHEGEPWDLGHPETWVGRRA